jgi:hypothetical protein
LLAILGRMGVAQVGIVVPVMKMLPNLDEVLLRAELEFHLKRAEAIALLAVGAGLFNGDCVATPRGSLVAFRLTYGEIDLRLIRAMDKSM